MKYYFITGTSKGLGHEIAIQLLEQKDCKVIGISRSNTIKHSNYQHFSIDLSNIEYLIENLDSIFIALPDAEKIVLINNAGILGEVAHVGHLSNKKIQDAFNVNTIAPAILMNEFIKKYLHCLSCQKTILNVSSGAGKKPVDGWASYCSSKAALDMFSNVVGTEKIKDKNNIRVFSVSPGIVDTEMQDEIRKVSSDGFSRLSEFVEYKKEGMLVSPKKVAKKYLHLLDNEEKFHEVLVSVRDF